MRTDLKGSCQWKRNWWLFCMFFRWFFKYV